MKVSRALIVVASLHALVANARGQSSFAGAWSTTYGEMTLVQKEGHVTGHYLYDGARCTIEGAVEKGRLTFKYVEPSVQGVGWFKISADGKSFRGQWKVNGTDAWSPWTGERVAAVQAVATSFSGIWSTTYGKMRLIQSKDRVRGTYGAKGVSTLEGTLRDNKLTFTYAEPEARGEGSFTLTESGLKGQWRETGSTAWRNWDGTRVRPVPGRKWLVVLEARWENDLSEKEYTFGAMLRAFFARSAEVQVRHRTFDDAESLAKWCREVAYLAEPVVLVVATHGTTKGATVDGKTISARTMAKSLANCDNVQLLHFSACEMLKDRLAAEMIAALSKEGRFPISGYASSVDWAASAIIEFAYFEMILMRGMTPSAAAKQVEKLMPFSGDTRIPGAALPPAKFRLLMPE